jgi:hypothetical protein
MRRYLPVGKWTKVTRTIFSRRDADISTNRHAIARESRSITSRLTVAADVVRIM